METLRSRANEQGMPRRWSCATIRPIARASGGEVSSFSFALPSSHPWQRNSTGPISAQHPPAVVGTGGAIGTPPSYAAISMAKAASASGAGRRPSCLIAQEPVAVSSRKTLLCPPHPSAAGTRSSRTSPSAKVSAISSARPTPRVFRVRAWRVARFTSLPDQRQARRSPQARRLAHARHPRVLIRSSNMGSHQSRSRHRPALATVRSQS
jgi:hypothetical protein